MEVDGRRRWLLAEDREALLQGEEGDRLLLLGPHDPYLDLRDRETVLPDQKLQRLVWRTVGNPGAVLLGGRAVGLWTALSKGGGLELSVSLFQQLSPVQRARLEELGAAYAAFRQLPLRRYAAEPLP